MNRCFKYFSKEKNWNLFYFFYIQKVFLGSDVHQRADCLDLRGIFFSEQFTIAELSIIANTQRANFFSKSTKSMITLKTMKRLKMYPTFLHPIIAYDILKVVVETGIFVKVLSELWLCVKSKSLLEIRIVVYHSSS